MPAANFGDNLGIYAGNGVHINVDEIEEIHQAIEEITTELIAILTTHFPSIESNYFIESGQSLEKYLLLLQSVNRAVGSEELIAPEPNLFGAIYSLATYYELIQGFANFALEQFKHIDETFEEKLKEFSTAKEGLING